MSEQFPIMSCQQLEAFAKDAFQAAGCPEEDAKFCANILIAADKRGISSHGIGRLVGHYIGRVKDGVQKAVTQIKFVKKFGAVAVIDGNNGMGQIVAKHAMEYAMECAQKYGIGMTAVRNSGHFGIAGYYTEMAARAGMIGMCGTNTRPSVAPTFGTENKLGTNPLAVSMPSDEPFPFTYDGSTCVCQRGKIETYGRLGKELPPGWVIGIDGKTRTDTAAILQDLSKQQAALVTLGGIGETGSGHKGYGFATIVELLSCALQQGAFLSATSGLNADGSKREPLIGHFFIAINVEAFTTLPEFRKTVGDVCRELRASRKAPGYDRIYTAGEKEYYHTLENEQKGIPLDNEIQKMMIKVRNDYHLTNWHFDFE